MPAMECEIEERPLSVRRGVSVKAKHGDFMDLLHWDLVGPIEMREAAFLASGLDPIVKDHPPALVARATVIEAAMSRDHETIKRAVSSGDRWIVRRHEETEESVFPLGSLPSVQLVEEVLRLRNTGDSFKLADDFLVGCPLAFTRHRLDAWFKSKNFVSAYDFIPKVRTDPPNQEDRAADTELTDAIRNTLLKQIAALAFAFSKISGKFKNGDRPNASQIAEATIVAVDSLPEANRSGLSSTNFRTSIKDGLELLTTLK